MKISKKDLIKIIKEELACAKPPVKVKKEAFTPDNNSDEMQRMHDFKGAEEDDLAHEQEEHGQIDELYVQLERVKEALSQFEAALSTLKGSEKKEHGF